MSIKTRIKQLEKQHAPEPVYGFRRDYGPVTVDGEEMTPEAFYKRYPAGEIIHIILLDGPPERKQADPERIAESWIGVDTSSKKTAPQA